MWYHTAELTKHIHCVLIAKQAAVKLGFKINTPLRQLEEIHTLLCYCVGLPTESIHAILSER